MITSPAFVIAHIARTGGEAIKAILRNLKLPDVQCTKLHDIQQHATPDLRGRDLILSIRRLPARELSHIKLAYFLDHLPTTSQRLRNETIGRFAIRLLNGEGQIKRITDNDRTPVAHYIRSEFLRSDLHAVLAQYFPLTAAQTDIITVTTTKRREHYDHDITQHFTHEDIAELYHRSPTWTKHERAAYGSTLAN